MSPSQQLLDPVEDPLAAVTATICAADPELDPAVVRQVVERVSGGRAKQRRLAAAIVDDSTALTTGRSPAPRPVGDLLLALRAAGSRVIAAPCCAGCGREVTAMQRRGYDWFCSPCFKRPDLCASCGNERQVAFRDRDGRPRCGQCRDYDPNPLAALVELITSIDPALTEAAVSAAIDATVTKPAHIQKLAWTLHANPELLTGGGAHAPFPMILRLIDALCEIGATVVCRPACPRCGRVVTLNKRADGVRVCRNCRARANAVACARCGSVREPAARDPQGQPLCPFCLVNDPVNHEACIDCGRRRRVALRSPAGPLCGTCIPAVMATCSVCEQIRPCRTSTVTGQPWCANCAHTWTTCSNCGTPGPIRGGTRSAPLCADCTTSDSSVWKRCPTCGQTGQLLAVDCTRCRLRRRVDELLTGPDGQIRPELRTLNDALTGVERPANVVRWVSANDAVSVLADFAAGTRPLTHAALDDLPDTNTLAHLRAVLVATNTLPARDEHLARLETWTTRTVNACADPDDRQVLHRYAHWHVLRRLRARTRHTTTTASQANFARGHIQAAATFLDWLAANQLTLATIRQGDLDRWMATSSAAQHGRTGAFIRWAKRQHLTALDFPATGWAGPTGRLDTEGRWEHTRRLLHDDDVALEDRVAGLLVLLYAQHPASISRLTLDDIHVTGRQVTIRFGREPVTLLEPVGGLVHRLINERRGHARIGADRTTRWLLPGGRPGQPISSFRLSERLRHLGMPSGQARSTALFQLASELPAAILARLLGIHITVAVKWQHAAGGDWTNYAAEISRRNDTHRPAHPQKV